MPTIFTTICQQYSQTLEVLVDLLIYRVLFQELADANKQRKELTLVEKVSPHDIFSTARIQGYVALDFEGECTRGKFCIAQGSPCLTLGGLGLTKN